MTSSVEIKNIIKKFPNNNSNNGNGNGYALDNLTLDIEAGKITGLIGPDGAGKTTLIRSIIGLLTPNSGEIKSLNFNPIFQKELLNEKIGYMPQKNGIYEDLSVIENLKLFATLKGVADKDFEKTFEYLLTFTDLKRFQERLAGKLSGGMKQKLGLACSLLGKPELLLLDEPSVGVDPISRLELMKMVKGLEQEGITILWSTAYLDEAQNFENCILLDKGKILYNGNPQELTNTMNNRVFLTRADDGNNRKLLKTIKTNWENVSDATIQSDYVRVVFGSEIQKNKNKNLTPTKPIFEDAVIDILGGAPKTESKLAQNFIINHENIEYLIEADNLVKRYGDFYAVKNNTFQIKRGEVFGLLGPNGAGKSTTFKMLCGLATPTSGTIKIMEEDIQINPTKARSYLGYMAQKFSLYGGLTVLQNLEFFAGIYGLYGKYKKEKIEEMINLFHFKKWINQNAEELPLGYKQRLALICATMHNPPILFLDEPTSGVDPLTRREFWNHINSLAEKGVTVMVTTHFMDEAEYCDRISLFYKGETIAIGSPTELKEKIGKDVTMEEAFIKLIEKYEETEEQK